jgi:alkanesulfonate monooxygenase SsuD/methylene tetrahydromethanopterin reductase-like flavin-dependent oxidoreductase (luciferase family)
MAHIAHGGLRPEKVSNGAEQWNLVYSMSFRNRGIPAKPKPSQSFALVDAAEAWGLDAMWLAELHFVPYRSVLASPLILAAAIAQRTRRMKIGTAVQVLPLCHPLRLAEEAATVDQISDGRLIFGVGRS